MIRRADRMAGARAVHRTHLAIVLTISLHACPSWADLVEMLNGQRLEGKVLGSTSKEVLLRMNMGGRSVEMKFRSEKVHAITVGDERRVINEKSGARPQGPKRTEDGSPRETSRSGGPSRDTPRPEVEKPAIEEPGTKESGKEATRLSSSQVAALISKAGRTPPDWWDSEPLDYPASLDLTWQRPPKGQWLPQKFLGPYIISVINPNQRKWKGAVKLLHHTLTVNRNDRSKLGTSMERMGHVYGNLLGDYARAAFWWQKAAKYGARVNSLKLADCYWKLGGKQMAVQLLQRLGRDRTHHGGIVKLWSDFGDLRKAISLAEEMASNHLPDPAYRAAGDACRAHGKYKQAVVYYQKVLEVPSQGERAKGIDKNKSRAQANIEAIRVFEALDLSSIPDGSYTGTATGYRGPVQVQVKVQEGRIESVKVTNHKEDWFYTSLTDVPDQIVEKQGVKGVDAVTGATMTSEAIINATAKALAAGMK